jgi:hypothetical protein
LAAEFGVSDPWFYRRRRFGYTITPASRNGWITVGGFLSTLFGAHQVILPRYGEAAFANAVVVAVAVLVALIFFKSAKPTGEN